MGRGVTTILIVAAILPFEITWSVIHERFDRGQMYANHLNIPSEEQPFRVAMIRKSGPATNLIYPTQLSIRGFETLGGYQVMVNKELIKRWKEHIGVIHVKGRMLAIPKDDIAIRQNQALDWLSINNTKYIVTDFEYSHPRLALVDHEILKIRRITQFIKFWGPPVVMNHYLYRLKGRGRVMAFNELDLPKKDVWLEYDWEANWMKERRHQPVKDVKINEYSASSINFTHEAKDTDLLLMSNNYYPGWELKIDGQPIDQGSQIGPFGMIVIKTMEGKHNYTLYYKDPLANTLLGFSIVGMILLYGLGLLIYREPTRVRVDLQPK